MFSFNSIILVLFLSCNQLKQETLTLRCHIEGKVSIKDSSEVLINKSAQAILVVDAITESGLEGKIIFKRSVKIPEDSKLHIIQGMVGQNLVEIRLGLSSQLLKNNDKIRVICCL